jgi:hypothetical protein
MRSKASPLLSSIRREQSIGFGRTWLQAIDLSTDLVALQSLRIYTIHCCIYRHCTIFQCTLIAPSFPIYTVDCFTLPPLHRLSRHPHPIVPQIWQWPTTLVLNQEETRFFDNKNHNTRTEGNNESAYQVQSPPLAEVASRLVISAGYLAPGLQFISRSIFDCLATEEQRAKRIGKTWARLNVRLAHRWGVQSHDSHHYQAQGSSCLRHQRRRD